jgi:hypothetical protein
VIRIISIAIFLLAAHCARSQTIIQGMVADSATFAPLPYVNVYLKGQARGTISDQQGNFKLVAAETDTLVLSFVGYRTLEFPLNDWEPSIILLAEEPTLLKDVTIEGERVDPYAGMFDEQNEQLRRANKKLPFYYSKTKKQNIRLGRLQAENERVKTYVDVVIRNEDNKNRLMKEYNLSETQYYDLLGEFNARHYTIMYYLTAPELVTLLNNFFASKHRK